MVHASRKGHAGGVAHGPLSDSVPPRHATTAESRHKYLMTQGNSKLVTPFRTAPDLGRPLAPFRVPALTGHSRRDPWTEPPRAYMFRRRVGA